MAKPGEKSAQDQTEKTGGLSLEEREARLKIREGELEKNLKNLNIIRTGMAKDHDATSVASGRAFTLAEIKEGSLDDSINIEMDFKGSVELEAFMHEVITINVYPDGMPGALDVVTPTVNGINQPIIRGFDQRIKRKYIEALARSRVTNYVQEVADPTRPENIHMKPLSALTYPFTVRDDRNPRGLAWLDAILRQPV